MSYQYKQVKYRADRGRFDGNLNRMADEGWTVVSIDRVDDLFLVTYSRHRVKEYVVDQCLEQNLDEVLEVNRRSHNELVKMVGATQRPNNDFLYTLVWEVTDDNAPQRRFTTSMNSGRGW